MKMKRVIKVVAVALAIMGLPKFIEGVAVTDFWFALVAALALGIVNLLIKPIVKLVTLPINIITLGLFGLVINGLLLWGVAHYVPGFEIDSFKAAFLSALGLSVVNWLFSKL